ncbi:helix-turn-helix domain-containing protein [Fusobacteria bacterium ZRK30]|nr:helix-turn-helix domain-containing protein [Fusobacteria bacterium ZRK30]
MSVTKVSDNKLKALGIFLKKTRERVKLGTNQLAAKIGISPSYITKLEKGHIATVHPYLLRRVAEGLRIDYKELYKIVDYLDEEEPIEMTSNGRRIETIKIPMYGTASAGPGYYNLLDELDEQFQIPIEDYKEGRFTVKIEGDSMTGIGGKSIPCGSIALVDPMMCSNIGELLGKVCVFTYNDSTYIKQLQIDEQEIIHLVSFNPNISDIIILNENELKCEGRVIKTYFEQKW